MPDRRQTNRRSSGDSQERTVGDLIRLREQLRPTHKKFSDQLNEMVNELQRERLSENRRSGRDRRDAA